VGFSSNRVDLYIVTFDFAFPTTHTQGLDGAVVVSNSLQLADKLRIRAAAEVGVLDPCPYS